MTKPQTISARVGDKQYSIIVGNDLEKELIEAVQARQPSRVALVSDDTVGVICGHRVFSWLTKAGFHVDTLFFPGGEQNKTQATVSRIQADMLAHQYGRDSLIVAVGGGVVGDVAGYVAATYMRGIPYIQVPTTILAMVDSSIGGKVGVDTPHGKNTIGTFWQPEAVISDIQFLGSLDSTQIASGILEAVKSFLTADKDALALVEKLDLEKPLSTTEELQEVIIRAASFKSSVVERDEREENERRILNFGHTVGHAIELLSSYKMPHGFAVGYGILVETKIAEDLGILSATNRKKVYTYLERFGIKPEGLKDFKVDDVLEAMKGDKKTRASTIHCVLLSGIGSIYTKGGQFAHPVEESVIRKGYVSLMET